MRFRFRFSTILTCKVKRQYLLTLQVSRYCILDLQSSIDIYTDLQKQIVMTGYFANKQLLLFAFVLYSTVSRGSVIAVDNVGIRCYSSIDIITMNSIIVLHVARLVA